MKKKVVVLLASVLLLVAFVGPWFYVTTTPRVFEGTCDDYLLTEFDYESYKGWTLYVHIIGDPAQSRYFPAETTGHYARQWWCGGSEYVVTFVGPATSGPPGPNGYVNDYYIGNDE